MPERLGFNPEQEPEHDEETRRSFLKKMAGGAAVLALGGKLAAAEDVLNRTGVEVEENASYDTAEVNKKHLYKTGPLQGHSFGNGSLFHYFTGHSGKVPETISVNFKGQLHFLFNKKEQFVQKHHKSNTAFKSVETALLKEYETKNPERESLRQYQKDVEIAVNQIDKHIDWGQVEEAMHLSDAETKLLKAIISAFGPKHLTAYALTELMPSADGELNKDVYEFLLKSAGARYVYSIPAIFDDRLSFGPYQFTSGALMDLGDNHPVGASVINQALPEKYRIPNSVAGLRELAHHKAALLFAIYNMARLVKRLNPHQLKTFEGVWHKNMTAVTQFVATAHHLPGAAYIAGERWLDGKAAHPFEVSCGKSIHEYAIKTKSNLGAL